MSKSLTAVELIRILQSTVESHGDMPVSVTVHGPYEENGARLDVRATGAGSVQTTIVTTKRL